MTIDELEARCVETCGPRGIVQTSRHASPETTFLYTRVPRDRLVAAVAAIEYGGAD